MKMSMCNSSLQIAASHNMDSNVKLQMSFIDRLKIAREACLKLGQDPDTKATKQWKINMGKMLYDMTTKQQMKQIDPFLQVSRWDQASIDKLLELDHKIMYPGIKQKSKGSTKANPMGPSESQLKDMKSKELTNGKTSFTLFSREGQLLQLIMKDDHLG